MQPNPPSSTATDPYRYGWRYVPRTRPDGKPDYDMVPLTLEDVLHPQEEDHIIERTRHEMDCTYLTEVFRSRPLGPAISRVTADLRIDWGVAGIRPHSPDVAVFVALKQEPDLDEGTLHLAESGGRPLLVVEVVSPHTRSNDAEVKVQHYHQVGVPFYVLIDQETEGGPRWPVGYRWAEPGYREVALDEAGRLLIQELGLYLLVRDGRVVCQDAVTGKELGDYSRLTQELEQADRRNQEQEQALEESIEAAQEHARARQRAEEQTRLAAQAQQQAEEQARAAALAKDDAEKKASAEAQARLDAEKKANAETQARLDAEKKASAEAQARERAEQRIRDLEALLRGLQGDASVS